MTTILGSGEHRYGVVENWAQLPAGWYPACSTNCGGLSDCGVAVVDEAIGGWGV